MGWITLIVGVTLLGAVVFVLGRAMARVEGEKDISFWGSFISKLVWPVVCVILLVGTCSSSVQQVPFGNVGILTQFGAIEGQVSEGLQLIPPWKGLMLANVQIQGLGFRSDKHLQSFSKESQDVFVEATVNFRVSPEAIQALYREVGPNYVDILVIPRVKQNFKDETVKYESVQIAPHREDIRKAVRDRLERELSRNSIEVVDLLLDNVDFLPEFKQAIENKQIATQDALREEQRVQLRRFEAQQEVEKAKGEGQALREVANGQADANKALAASLTPEVIQFQALQKLSDNIQIALIPSGQGLIIDPTQLFGGAKR
ncbi:MAG: prohibitin family protein [bacterium]|nr:prohibitin family protein [bacterium]